MTVRDAAEKIGCSPSLVYELVAERRLGCRRVGRRGKKGKIVISEQDVERFLEAVKVAAE